MIWYRTSIEQESWAEGYVVLNVLEILEKEKKQLESGAMLQCRTNQALDQAAQSELKLIISFSS